MKPTDRAEGGAGAPATLEIDAERHAAIERRARELGTTVDVLVDRIVTAALDEELSTS